MALVAAGGVFVVEDRPEGILGPVVSSEGGGEASLVDVEGGHPEKGVPVKEVAAIREEKAASGILLVVPGCTRSQRRCSSVSAQH